MKTTTQQMARQDALQAARSELMRVRRSLALCEARGWTWDAATCREDVTRLEARIATLELEG